MLSKQWLAIVTGVVIPLSAIAQQNPFQYGPADADAPVSAMVYQSVFQHVRESDDERAAPDKQWRAANDAMGKLGGHAGQMKEVGERAVGVPDDGAAGAKQSGGHAEHHRG